MSSYYDLIKVFLQVGGMGESKPVGIDDARVGCARVQTRVVAAMMETPRSDLGF